MKFVAVVIPLLLTLSSCEKKGESEEMKQYKERQVELKEMQDNLSRLSREIERKEIPNPAPNLKKIEAEIEAVKSEKSELVAKIESLKTEKKEKMREFEKYQKDYPISSK